MKYHTQYYNSYPEHYVFLDKNGRGPGQPNFKGNTNEPINWYKESSERYKKYRDRGFDGYGNEDMPMGLTCKDDILAWYLGYLRTHRKRTA